MAQPDLKVMALVEALAALRIMQRRYNQLRELDGLWTVLDDIEAAAKKPKLMKKRARRGAMTEVTL